MAFALAALVSGAGSLLGASMNSSAAQRASQQQSFAALAAAQMQTNLAAQGMTNLAPYNWFGQGNLGNLQSAMGQYGSGLSSLSSALNEYSSAIPNMANYVNQYNTAANKYGDYVQGYQGAAQGMLPLSQGLTSAAYGMYPLFQNLENFVNSGPLTTQQSLFPSSSSSALSAPLASSAPTAAAASAPTNSGTLGGNNPSSVAQANNLTPDAYNWSPAAKAWANGTGNSWMLNQQAYNMPNGSSYEWFKPGSSDSFEGDPNTAARDQIDAFVSGRRPEMSGADWVAPYVDANKSAYTPATPNAGYLKRNPDWTPFSWNNRKPGGRDHAAPVGASSPVVASADPNQAQGMFAGGTTAGSTLPGQTMSTGASPATTASTAASPASAAASPTAAGAATGSPSTATGTSGLSAGNLPGLQFQEQYGDLSTQNALAAQGLGGSAGPLSKALSDYNQGLAGTYYPQYYNMYLGGLNSGINAYGNYMTGLQNSMSGYGQYLGALQTGLGAYGNYLGGLGNSAALYNSYLGNYPALISGAGSYMNALGNRANLYQNAAGLGESAAAGSGNIGVQTGANVGNSLQNSGNALAAGTLGSANALSGGFTGLGNAFSNYALLSSMSGGGGGGLFSGGGAGSNGLSLGGALAGLSGGLGSLFGGGGIGSTVNDAFAFEGG